MKLKNKIIITIIKLYERLLNYSHSYRSYFNPSKI